MELQTGLYGFDDAEKVNSSFLTYFEIIAEKRRDSDGNYGNWISALKHLKNWEKSNVSFTNIDHKWLEELKHYFINDAKTKQGKNLSKNSCVSYFNKVLATLKEALKEGIISKNPAVNIDGIKEAETKREFLTLEELKKAVAAHCEIELVKNAFLLAHLQDYVFQISRSSLGQKYNIQKKMGITSASNKRRPKDKKPFHFPTMP